MATDYNAVRRSPYFFEPKKKERAPKSPRKPKTLSKQTIDRQEALRAQKFERILASHPELRMVKEAAEQEGMCVTYVRMPCRNLCKSQLLIDGVIHEVHYLRRPIQKSNPQLDSQSVSGKVSINQRRYQLCPMHIFLVNLEAHGVLKAYRIPTEDLTRRLFARPRPSGKVDVCIQAFSHGRYGTYHLNWTFKRPPPPEA